MQLQVGVVVDEVTVWFEPSAQPPAGAGGEVDLLAIGGSLLQKRTMIPKAGRSTLMWAGIGFAVLFWVIESFVHVSFCSERVGFIDSLITPEPHEFWMRAVVVTLLIAFGIFAQIIVSKRLQAEEAVSRAYAELDQIFQTSGDGMRVIGRDFNVLKINETFSALSGMGREEAVGRKCYEVFPGRQCNTPECPLARIINGEERLEYEVEKERRDGEKVPCIVTATSFRAPDGELIGIVENFKDITERKSVEKTLELRAQELARSNAELQQFAYVASHDLQEPLRMVASYVQLLARRYKGRLDADADDFIGFAVDGATRMQILINDLLAYSRVGTRGKPFEPTDCEAVLQRVLTNLRMMIEENRGSVTHDPLPTVMADDIQLEQLLQNLIANSLKFHGEEPLTIHVSARLNKKLNSGMTGEWIFSVSDNGIGIDPEYAERIFVIFQRLHGREQYPGTGIGLAICKKIVERHGGRIWVESQPGKGATFYFTLPGL
jgi:PAS domain S-box-containing protein